MFTTVQVFGCGFLYLVFFFIFSYEDPNFTWDNAGATLFTAAAAAPPPKTKADEEGSDEDEAPNNLDIHFEPIVSLPEVQLGT